MWDNYASVKYKSGKTCLLICSSRPLRPGAANLLSSGQFCNQPLGKAAGESL